MDVCSIMFKNILFDLELILGYVSCIVVADYYYCVTTKTRKRSKEQNEQTQL